MRTPALIILILTAGICLAQTNITGKVIDENNEPLIGVNVSVKDANTGTITDFDGNFVLDVPDSKSILVFSYIGYKIKEMAAPANRKPMVVQLFEDKQLLDEVVVVGYQDMKKRDVSGSVSSVDVGEMLKAPVSAFDQALAGRVAGVQVSSSEGMPGGTMNIVIRGANSVTQDNSPLYIVDGFPVEDANVASTISPNDIASIDILKDASATAIYGSRGANGVVIITTKKGKVGRLQITYDGNVGVQHVSRKLPVMSTYEFVKLQSEIRPATELNTYYGYFPTKQQLLDNYGAIPNSYFAALLADKPNDYHVTLEDYRDAPTYDWQDMIFRDAIQHSHDISLTGGSPETRYNASVNYFDQDGIILRSNYKRVQGKVGLDIHRDRLAVNLKANYTYARQLGASPSQSEYSGMNNLFYSVWGYRPFTQPGIAPETLVDNNMDASVNASQDYRFNPIKSLQNEYNLTTTRNARFNAAVEYEFIKGLKLHVTGGYTFNGRDRENFNNSDTRYGMATSTYKVNALYGRYYSSSWINEDYLTYQTTVKKYHHLNAMVGFSYQGNIYKYYSMSSGYIPYESLGMAGMADGTPTAQTSGMTEWAMISAYARFNYDYKSRYYVTATFRADGSSKMAKGHRFGYFPSASVAWTITEEDWAKPAKPWLSNAKLRVSWGQTGNNRVGEYAAYAQIEQLKANSGSVYGTVYPYNNQVDNVGVTTVSLPNTDLKWETTTQTDVGLDLGFFSDRLNFTVDWYNKVTSDLLLSADLMPSSGYVSATKNIGAVRNRGWELSINTVNIDKKNFRWETSFNISFNENKILSLAENQTAMLTNARFDQNYTSANYIAKVGCQIGMMYGYIYEGTYKPEDFDVNGSLLPGIAPYSAEGATQPGMPRYRDINEDGVIDSNDMTIIGRGAPIHTGGFNNTWSFYGVDVSVFFQWSYGNDIINANRLFFDNGTKMQDLNMFASYADRWSETHKDSDIPVVSNSASNKVFSSRIIEDGSYLRLKSVSIGYTLPQDLTRKVKIERVHFGVSAQNLWTLTRYSGYDPEVSVRNSALTPGLDFSSYPRAMSFNFNFNITF